MNTGNLTVVHMTETEAERFITFQKHYAFVMALEEIGAFNIKSGSVQISFDSQGRIGKIEKREFYTP